jgi:hypothetical protein
VFLFSGTVTAPPLESIDDGEKPFYGDSPMRRLFLGLVAVAALAACTDSTPTGTRQRPDLRARSAITTAETQEELDEQILAIIACFKQGQENDFEHRWAEIKKKYEQGQTDPKKLKEAIKKLFEMGKKVAKEKGKIEELPCEGYDTADEAASALMQFMVLYVFGGNASGENVSGVLLPDEELTLYTPQHWLGLHFDEGSTKDPRIIVVTQSPNEDYDFPCEENDGPLLTKLCQYPLFYDIQSFPDDALLKVATIQICHPPVGSPYGPANGTVHDNLRLAHTKPNHAADYTPGGSIRDTPASEENIEILPWDEEDLITDLDCEDADYPTPTGGSGPSGPTGVGLLQRGGYFASAFASGVVKFLTPKSAYAIDQGFGGSFIDFSPFNYVDICSSANPEPSCDDE